MAWLGVRSADQRSQVQHPHISKGGQVVSSAKTAMRTKGWCLRRKKRYAKKTISLTSQAAGPHFKPSPVRSKDPPQPLSAPTRTPAPSRQLPARTGVASDPKLPPPALPAYAQQAAKPTEAPAHPQDRSFSKLTLWPRGKRCNDSHCPDSSERYRRAVMAECRLSFRRKPHLAQAPRRKSLPRAEEPDSAMPLPAGQPGLPAQQDFDSGKPRYATLTPSN